MVYCFQAELTIFFIMISFIRFDSMFAKTKKWLETEQFIYEEINEIRYPTIETIITIHDYLIEAFIAEGETVHRGLISDAALSFHGI